ncbi:uncharacterized protein LOC118519865 [Halichoerus grypus]
MRTRAPPRPRPHGSALTVRTPQAFRGPPRPEESVSGPEAGIPGQAPPLALRRQRALWARERLRYRVRPPGAGALQAGPAVCGVRCAGDYEPREGSSSQGCRHPSRFQATDVKPFAVPALTAVARAHRRCCVHCGARPVSALSLHSSVSCRADAPKQRSVGFCAREFGSQETKEAWRAPGAEDPSFNTFAVPLTPIHSFADDLGYQGSQELTSTRSPCVAGWVGESTLSSLSDSPGKKTPASPRPGGGSGARGRTRCRRRTRPAGPRARAVPEAGAEAVPGLAGARAAAEGAPQRPGEQRQHARVPGRGFAPQPGRLPPVRVRLLRRAGAGVGGAPSGTARPPRSAGGGLRGRAQERRGPEPGAPRRQSFVNKAQFRGAWVAQLVKRLPSAQVMILESLDRVPGSSPWIESLDRVPHRAPCSAGNLLLPLTLRPLMCLLSLILSLSNK